MERRGFLRETFEENKFVWGAFLLATVVMLLVYTLLGCYPMGSDSILKIDMYHQYAPFHEELRNKLINGGSFLYSWEGGLGKNFISQFAYYTASPLSLLMVFFPAGNAPEGMAFLVLVKISFSASFFAYYLKKKFERNDITIVIFALMYASMAFITSYYWNVMWLDAVALFPIVALGIESLVKDKKYKMYCISLTVVILANFYIAFLVCVFGAVYFFVYLFLEYSWKNDKKVIMDRVIRFFVLSFIAGGISMFLIIPTIISISHTYTSTEPFPDFEVYRNVYQLLTSHFIGARPIVLAKNSDVPNVYSGLFTIMLIPLYYLNKNIKLREKVLYSLFLGFMLLCCCINALDFAVHGLHFPASIPHRFTFIYSFAIIVMAYKAFINIKAVKNIDYYYIFLCVFTAIIVITEFLIVPFDDEFKRVLDDYDFIIIGIFGAVYLALILRLFNGGKKYNPLACLALAVFIECVFSTTAGFSYQTKKINREDYVRYVDGVERAVKYINEKDGKDFNRTEMYGYEMLNSGSFHNFKGYSNFSSLAYGNTSLLMRNLGIAATSNSCKFYEPTPLIGAIFNVKYIIGNLDSDVDSADDEAMPFIMEAGEEPKPFFIGTKEEEETLGKVKDYLREKTGSDDLRQVFRFEGDEKTEVYEKIKEITGNKSVLSVAGINPDNSDDFIYIYENPYALPLGFIVKGSEEYNEFTLENLKNKYALLINESSFDYGVFVDTVNGLFTDVLNYIDLEDKGAFGVEGWITDYENPFDVQNSFVFHATDIKESLMNILPITNISVNNVSENGKIVELIKFKYKGEEDEDNESEDDFMDVSSYLKEFGIKNINRYKLTRPEISTYAYVPIITFDIDVNKTGRTFIYADALSSMKCEYMVTTPDGKTKAPKRGDVNLGRGFIDVGDVDKGSKITLNIELSKKDDAAKVYHKSGLLKVYAANLNNEVFERVYDRLSKTPMVVSEYGDDFVKAGIETDKDGFLFTSIPYDDGWTVTVDGAEAEKIAFGNGGLLGIYMTEGSHDINFSYYPVGFNEGILITAVSIAFLFCYGFFDTRERKKENGEAERQAKGES